MTPWITACNASLSITNSWSSLDSRPLSQWCHPSHLILCRPLLLLPTILPSIRVFSNESTLRMRWQSTAVSALASFLPKKSQGWSPCSPRDSQESSPAPQFKGINSLAFHFVYGPALTRVYDHWEDHSLVYTDLCQQNHASARFVITFLPRSNFLLISWLQSPFAVILEPK